MLYGLLALLFWLPGPPPFWEAREPADWTEAEVKLLLSDSPWASRQGAQVFLASAAPIAAAEGSRHRAPKPGAEDPAGDDDYAIYLRDNPGKHLIVAISLPDPSELNIASESRRMEEDCILKVGRMKYKMIGHFPPTPRDPYLRLLYPRVITDATKSFSFEFYLPSVRPPYRMFQFFPKEMSYRGKLAY